MFTKVRQIHLEELWRLTEEGGSKNRFSPSILTASYVVHSFVYAHRYKLPESVNKDAKILFHTEYRALGRIRYIKGREEVGSILLVSVLLLAAQRY